MPYAARSPIERLWLREAWIQPIVQAMQGKMKALKNGTRRQRKSDAGVEID